MYDNLLITTVDAYLYEYGEEDLDYDDIIRDFEKGIGTGGIGTLRYIYADYSIWLKNRTSQILKTK